MSSQSTCQWSQISTDFDPDEETANFGTRHALEADGKLFDVFTYATIEPKVIFQIIVSKMANGSLPPYIGHTLGSSNQFSPLLLILGRSCTQPQRIKLFCLESSGFDFGFLPSRFQS